MKVTSPQLRISLSLSLCPPPSFLPPCTCTLRTYPLPYDLEKRDTLQGHEPGGWHWPHNSEQTTVQENKGMGCWPINVTFSSHCFLFENPSTCHSPSARLIHGTSTFQALRLPLCICFTSPPTPHCYFQYYLSRKVRKLRVYVEWEGRRESAQGVSTWRPWHQSFWELCGDSFHASVSDGSPENCKRGHTCFRHLFSPTGTLSPKLPLSQPSCLSLIFL